MSSTDCENFISREEYLKVSHTSLLFLGGEPDSSVIAECALRFGFSHLTFVDNSRVELSDLQNDCFSRTDVGNYKVEAIKRKLLEVDPTAEISLVTADVTAVDLESLIVKHDIAINLLRKFPTKYSVLFNTICLNLGVPVLHTYNIGWAGIATVINKHSQSLEWSNLEYRVFIKMVADYYRYWGTPQHWLEDVLNLNKECKISIGSWILGGLITNILYDIVVGNNVRCYPQFYMMTIKI